MWLRRITKIKIKTTALAGDELRCASFMIGTGQAIDYNWRGESGKDGGILIACPCVRILPFANPTRTNSLT